MIKAKTIDPVADLASFTDMDAIQQVRSGNTNMFEVIMRRYNQRLYRIARSILKEDDLAQDAIQQAYISAYLNLDSYLPKCSFGAWLTRITINEALMIKRKPDNRTETMKELFNEDKLSSSHKDPAIEHANKELATLIESAIEQLPEEFRYVFILRKIQQLSTKETADSLNINEVTVKTRLHRARNMMQETLNQHIEQAGMSVYEFAGQRCDNIVKNILNTLDSLTSKNVYSLATENQGS